MTDRRGRLAAAAVGVWLLTACGGNASEEATPSPAAPGVCQPVDGPLAGGSTLREHTGTYRLTLVRTGADQASVEGTLTLSSRPTELRSLRGASTPLQGLADIDLGGVGAQRMGALDSDDPEAPGVLVLETDGASPSVMLRFGSAANRTDQVAFDGGFTALTVLEIDGDGFAGTWRSAVRDLTAEGYFCAVRDAD